MQTPYNTGKVLIGCRYTPPPPRYHLSADEELLQRALLGIGPNRASLGYWVKLWSLSAFLIFGLVVAAR